MRVGRSRPLGGIVGAYRAASAGRAAAGAQGAAAGAAAPAAEAAPAVTDVPELCGIPAAEMTPRVRRAIIELMTEVGELRQELARTRARLVALEQLADQDTLAPVRNRRAFVRDMARALSLARRQRIPVSLIFLDLTDFKQVNDAYGHTAGDAALLKVAETLEAQSRASDVVGRLGGDEFGVLLLDAARDQAERKAQEMAAAILARPLLWQGHRVPIRTDYGVYEVAPGDDPATALAAADEAMYRNKAAQRGATAP